MIKMDLKKFENFNWIEMDLTDQNMDLTRTKRISWSTKEVILHICTLIMA